MAAQKDANDPLARAFAEAPVAREPARSGITERRTQRARPVGEVLDALRAQAKDAMAGPFFDEGATATSTPVMKRVRSEAGAVEVSAKRREPSVKASVAIDVRCDRDEHGDAGRYRIRAEGRVGRDTAGGLIEADVPVSVEADRDGGLKLDAEGTRAGIADAIRSTGTPRPHPETR